MADLSDLQAVQSVKIIGANSSGLETNPVDATTNGLKVEAVGNIASASTDSGNPLKVGGVYNDILPTVTNGQRVDQQLSNRGELLTKEINSHQRITGAGTTVIKSGAGYLRRVVISGPANSTITLYDNTAGSGTIIAVINAVNGTAPSFLEFGISFTTGLTVVTTGAGSNYNILYS